MSTEFKGVHKSSLICHWQESLFGIWPSHCVMVPES